MFQSILLETIYIPANRSVSASVPVTAIVIQEVKVLFVTAKIKTAKISES